jgi:hypothetical protein
VPIRIEHKYFIQNLAARRIYERGQGGQYKSEEGLILLVIGK